jgi:hypothetical protein
MQIAAVGARLGSFVRGHARILATQCPTDGLGGGLEPLRALCDAVMGIAWIQSLSLLAHAGIPGAGPFIAYGLFLGGVGAGVGAYVVHGHEATTRRRLEVLGLGALAAGCLALAMAVPFILHVPTGRPSSTARLSILSPVGGERFQGDPAMIPVRLRLVSGTITPVTSFHLRPNTGHIHLYLDGRLASMTTGMDAQISAPPGTHSLRAEFVAMDHQPFDPRIEVVVTFEVDPA